jgi:hypothetical protein
MVAASPSGPVSHFVLTQLAGLLDQHRVVVWYDEERAFEALAPRAAGERCRVVSAAASALRARRVAEEAYRQLSAPSGDPTAVQNLLIYLPRARGDRAEERLDDPFEGLARCGAAFGDAPGETLLALAQRAMPDRADELARRFRDAAPTLDLLDALPDGARYPLVRQALGTEAPVEAIAASLIQTDAVARLGQVPGAPAELAQLRQDALGFPSVGGESADDQRERLVRFLLVSELADDLPGGLPSALDTVPHAEPEQRGLARAIVDRLRETASGQDLLLRLAPAVEGGLHLAAALGDSAASGHRDTFPIQEHHRFRTTVGRAVAGDLSSARAYFQGGTESLWRRQPERVPLWQVVGRCLAFLEIAAALAAAPCPESLRGLVDAYVAPDGCWRLDHAQRHFEQAAAQCAG